MASITRAEALLVSGYGLVVGLSGTGGGDLDERIAATMERQLGLMGFSRSSPGLEGTAFEGMTPRQVLRSRNVAVVTVYAAVVPGAPVGTSFDVFVKAVSPSPDISLEGGILYTTELQIGPPSPFGGYNKKAIATARGPIFINPFAQEGTGTVSGQIGRVLGGGRIVSPLDLQIVLDNESFQRASDMTHAINNRFPAENGEGPTAHGRNRRVIEIGVPSAYREKASEFLNLLLHVQIDSGMPQEWAKRYSQALKAQPYLAEDLRWCLQALPQRAAVPFLRELYDSTERAPRMAAIRAGAGLGDPLVAPHLKRLAAEGSVEERVEAISMLGGLVAGPSVDTALLDQLEARELSVRIAAYEALAARAEQVQYQRYLDYLRSLPPAARATLSDRPIDAKSQLEMAGDTIQGVRRKQVEGKFVLDMVPRGEPLIYVTQQGRPRIVIFGTKAEVQRPVLVSVWPVRDEMELSGASGVEAASGGALPVASHKATIDRLVVVADSPTDDLRIMYRYPDSRDERGNVIRGATVTGKVSPDLASLIDFLAHTPSPDDPRPGLGMPYSEVVGALHAIQEAGAIDAAFAVEEDLLRAALTKAATVETAEDRPETRVEAERREKLRVFKAQKSPEAGVGAETGAERAPAAPEPPRSLVVPLPPPKVKEKK
jgi:hypothetical protein